MIMIVMMRMRSFFYDERFYYRWWRISMIAKVVIVVVTHFISFYVMFVYVNLVVAIGVVCEKIVIGCRRRCRC